MNVSEIMTPSVHIVPRGMSLYEVAGIMRDTDIGFLVVGEGEKYVGTVTDRDIVVRSTAAGSDPRTDTVDQVIEPNLITCSEDDRVEDVADLMGRHQVRRLPVMNRQGRLVGVVSLGDLATRTKQSMAVGAAESELAKPSAAANAVHS